MSLDEILAHKRIELERARALEPADALARRAESAELRPRGFAAALRAAPEPRIVAELKRRSPSRGEIRPDFDPVACARAYQDGGAVALSVLTDERFFGGHLGMLEKVRAAVTLPLLRKDFVIDASQIDEARLGGADAVLLIAAALGRASLRALSARARALDLDALVEVHDEAELDAALEAGAMLVGINNRDLRTFETDLAVTERLAPRVPQGVLVVAESGIFHANDLARLARAGAHAFLVGESLMRQPDLSAALRTLRRGP
ncbi:MAG TPA: indole-3-glycerol phosphate synthase TrpC [Myxococcota bacterium]|nr:indole-3-glycerol phosphate synthase TrpC [Myxococcota bacterium]